MRTNSNIYATVCLQLVSLTSLASCMTGSGESGEFETSDGLMPFHAAAFGHSPTSDEVMRELQNFLAARPSKEETNALPPGNNINPSVGSKLVSLTVVTGSNAFDGTGQAAKAYFTGTWLTNASGSPAYSERFILDYPNRNDLNTGSTLVFYYTLPVTSYVQGVTQDQFQRGRVGNSSADRWNCNSVQVLERNHLLRGSPTGGCLAGDATRHAGLPGSPRHRLKDRRLGVLCACLPHEAVGWALMIDDHISFSVGALDHRVVLTPSKAV